MNQELFVDFLKHFKKCVPGGVSVKNPHLLLLDGHGSHMSEEAILLARSMGLEMSCIPPHSSHKLQSLDVWVFRPFKVIKFGQMRSNLIADNPTWLNGENNKAMLAELASKALMATCSPENIIAGFKNTSIYPFNHQALDLDFGPNTVFAEDGVSSCHVMKMMQLKVKMCQQKVKVNQFKVRMNQPKVMLQV